MLVVRHDPTRKIEEGQYYVCLCDNRDTDPENAVMTTNRLGYWCDKVHLRHMARRIFAHLADDIVGTIFGPDQLSR